MARAQTPRQDAEQLRHRDPALPERDASLWRLTTGPVIWALHFLACYVIAAVYCAKAASAATPLDDIRLQLGAATVLALAAIAWSGWRGWRQHRRGAQPAPHDAPTAGDRQRFLGFATMLLCGLSFVAVVYSGFVLLVIGTCR